MHHFVRLFEHAQFERYCLCVPGKVWSVANSLAISCNIETNNSLVMLCHVYEMYKLQCSHVSLASFLCLFFTVYLTLSLSSHSTQCDSRQTKWVASCSEKAVHSICKVSWQACCLQQPYGKWNAFWK